MTAVAAATLDLQGTARATQPMQPTCGVPEIVVGLLDGQLASLRTP